MKVYIVEWNWSDGYDSSNGIKDVFSSRDKAEIYKYYWENHPENGNDLEYKITEVEVK